MRIEPKLAEKLCEIDSSYSKFLETNGSMLVQLAKSLYENEIINIIFMLLY
jgi:hypothetical protein